MNELDGIYEFLKEQEAERDYMLSQLNNSFDPVEQNRLIGRIYQLTLVLHKLYEMVGKPYELRN